MAAVTVGKTSEDQKPVLAVHALTNVNSISSILRSVLYLLMAVSTSKPLAPHREARMHVVPRAASKFAHAING